MIGKTVHAHPSFPFFATIFSLLGLGLVLAALFYHNANLGLAALFFAALALGNWFGRESAWSMEFDKQSLSVSAGDRTILYDSLQALTPANGFTSRRLLSEETGAFDVFHRDGVLRVPAQLDRPTHEVYAFFLDLMTVNRTGARDVPDHLVPYLEKQIATFGEDRVWSFVQRAHTRRPNAYSAATWYALTLLVCGIAWIVAGVASKPQEPWIVAGVFAILMSGLCLLVACVFPLPIARPGRSGSRAGLVISPLGLALNQGDIQGELRWDELRALTLGVPSKWGATPPAHAIQLRVEGAEIYVSDIYDRPLELIYAQMASYWRSGR